MEKSIIALLNKNLRVIIPDLGAFIIRQKQPKIIVFNEFLRYNDGLLIDYIVNTEGIEREIAEQQVSDYAENCSRLLESGKDLIIDGLGKLHREASGKINLIDSDEIKEIEETFKPSAPAVNLKTKPKKEPSATRKAAKVTKARKERKPAGTVKSTRKVLPAKNEPEPPLEMPETEEPVRIIEPIESIPAMPLPEPPEIIEYPRTLPETDNLRVNQKRDFSGLPPDDKISTGNKTNQVLAWIILFLFVNAVILSWFVFGDRIGSIFKKKAVPAMITDSVYRQLADSVRAAAEDTSLVYKAAVENPVKNNAGIYPSGTRFYIVAGCFRDEANAEVLVESLKGMGYKAAQFGKIGNLYAVCFASFDNKDQAVLELRKIREKVPDAWMTQF